MNTHARSTDTACLRHGFTLVELCVVGAILSLLLALLMPTLQRVRAAADQVSCLNNLRQIGQALTLYHTNHQSLPPGCSIPTAIERMPFAAWTTRILPYVEHGSLYDQASQAFQTSRDFLHLAHQSVRSCTVPCSSARLN